MDPNTNFVLTDTTTKPEAFAEASPSGRIDLGHNKSTEGVIYQMATATKTASRTPAPDGKTWGQVYYEEVEALVAEGFKNADAVREVAQKYSKEVNAVRGGIFQYKKSRGDGHTPSTGRRSRNRATTRSYDDYLAEARTALEAARDLIDKEVDEARSAFEAAKTRLEQVEASVKDRKADIEKKLKALQ